ncbi:MAG: FAD-dependent monooxygenase [Gemmatimonadetes bacterium]|nr:FAD-dependent monooxygenase [Gemmatimonadota bacterium]
MATSAPWPRPDRSPAMSPSDRRSATPVAIVGAGPVGLSLALGLARHGVRSVLVERKESTSDRSKAPAIHVRTREIFRQWGIEERFLEAGVLRQSLILHSPAPGRRPLMSVDFSQLAVEAERPGLLVLEQAHTEKLLLEAVLESGLCEIRFATEVVGLVQGSGGATLTLHGFQGERSLDAEFVVGCDGAGSFVRVALGLPFEGVTYSVRPMLADIRIADERDALPWPRTHNGRSGLTTAIRLSPGLWRLIRIERGEPTQAEEVSAAEVNDRMTEVLGEGDFESVWASRFRIHRRSSPRFRVGRVLLAGDAAHVHSPVGGLGMNGGIQDAHNLAWKLAYALRGGDLDRLLDSYEVERRAVIVESVSRYTDLITRSFLDSPAMMRQAAFTLFQVLLRSSRIRRMNLRRTAMLDLDYPASPLLDSRERAAGVRLPNPLLQAPDGTAVRLYDLLPNAPVMLEMVEASHAEIDLPVEKVIRLGQGGYHDPSGLLRRQLGSRTGWMLVRPDTHIAWARRRPDGMRKAVRHALGTQDRL